MTDTYTQLKPARDAVRAGIESSLTVGDFTLASGRPSRYFFDLAQVTMRPALMGPLAVLLRHAVADVEFDLVGGPATGAIPLALATAANPERPDLMAFYTQKTTIGLVNKGPLVGTGDRVVVVDDVATTGASVLDTIKMVEAVGAKVVRVVCVVDRLMGARAALLAYDFRPLFTLKDFSVGGPS